MTSFSKRSVSIRNLFFEFYIQTFYFSLRQSTPTKTIE